MENLMTNYTIIDNNLITNHKLSNGAYRCHNILLSMTHGTKFNCSISIKYLTEHLHKNTKMIDRYLKELIEQNLIVNFKINNGSISCNVNGGKR